jgi:S1-C subfamily serine protease
MRTDLLFFFVFLFTLCVSGESRAQDQARKKTDVTLGIEPDYWYTLSGTGLKVKRVIRDRPAEAAGIRAGDIILAMDTVLIKNVFSYQDALSRYRLGDSALIIVMREKRTLDLRAVFR